MIKLYVQNTFDYEIIIIINTYIEYAEQSKHS